MAISGNIATEVGDIFIIPLDPGRILSTITLRSFTDDTDGENGSTFFTKEFRYSKDNGLTYTSWVALTNGNLDGIEIAASDLLKFEARYTHTGVNGSLTFNSITLDSEYVTQIDCSETWKRSIFSNFFDTCSESCSTAWISNMLLKLKNTNTYLAAYVNRGEDYDDTDFDDLWETLLFIWAQLICYVKVFQNVNSTSYPYLLSEFSRQLDLILCNTDTASSIQTLLHSRMEQIAKRGTESTDEIKRLLCVGSDNENVSGIHERESVGWVLGKNTPVVSETRDEYWLNKIWEKGVTGTLGNLPTAVSGGGAVAQNATDEALEFTLSGANQTSALGVDFRTDSTGDPANNAIIVDPNFSYVLSFKVRQLTALKPALYVGAYVYDTSNTKLTIAQANQFYSSVTYALEAVQLNILNTWYNVDIVIYGKNVPDSQCQLVPNIGEGVNLKFNNLTANTGVVKIIPFIGAGSQDGSYGSGSTQIDIKDVSLRPLNTKFTHFLGSKDMYSIWSKNLNTEHSEDEIYRILREKLVPYNSFLNIQLT